MSAPKRLTALGAVSLALAISQACVTVVMPVNEYNLARTAMEAAQESEAARFAPAIWYKAELAYREGQGLYRERNYEAARSRFNAARTFAEQAENAARLGRLESEGGG